MEFALISTLLLILLFAIISFGLTYSRYQVLIGAAREGARGAAVGDTQAEAQAKIDNAAPQDQYPHENASWTVNGCRRGPSLHCGQRRGPSGGLLDADVRDRCAVPSSVHAERHF